MAPVSVRPPLCLLFSLHLSRGLSIDLSVGRERNASANAGAEDKETEGGHSTVLAGNAFCSWCIPETPASADGESNWAGLFPSLTLSRTGEGEKEKKGVHIQQDHLPINVSFSHSLSPSTPELPPRQLSRCFCHSGIDSRVTWNLKIWDADGLRAEGRPSLCPAPPPAAVASGLAPP